MYWRKSWKRGKGGNSEGMVELEKRVKNLEVGRGTKLGGEGEGVELMMERIRAMEWKIERKEREERKKNIVIKGLKVMEGKMREEVMEKMGMEVKIREIRRIGKKKGVEGEMVARLDSEEERRKVMEGKRRLKGSKIWVAEDLTWRERRKR